MLYPARLSNQSRFFIALDFGIDVSPHLNVEIHDAIPDVCDKVRLGNREGIFVPKKYRYTPIGIRVIHLLRCLLTLEFTGNY